MHMPHSKQTPSLEKCNKQQSVSISHALAGILPCKETDTLPLFGSLTISARFPLHKVKHLTSSIILVYKKNNLGIASTAAAPLQPVLESVAYAHRSVRTTACHSLMEQELQVTMDILTQNIVMGYLVRLIYIFNIYIYNTLCVVWVDVQSRDLMYYYKWTVCQLMGEKEWGHCCHE